MSRLLTLPLVVLAAAALLVPSVAGAQGTEVPPGLELAVGADVAAELAELTEEVKGDLAGGDEGGMRLSAAVEIALLLTVLSLVPALLISVTCFTRIVIVLSFVRRSLAVNDLPPNPVLIGLALFLTAFVMGPVFGRIHETAYQPYKAGEIEVEEAADLAWTELRGFLLANTREGELAFFAELAGTEPSLDEDGNVVELPLRVVVPAFVLSELKTSFQMGFLLFLPFLVIDLIVSSILISMGMFMLPPVMISTPFKILLFVLVDGWRLVCESLVTSFVTL
jgi:flagellar biosynthetic protein FliP